MRIISWRRRIRFELWWWLWRRYVRFFLLWFQCISLHMTHQMIRGDMGALLFIYHLMTFYHFLIIHVAISQTNTNHDVQPIIMSTNLLSCGCWSCWIRLKNGVRLTGIVIYWGVSDQDKYIIWYVNTRGSRRNCRTLVYFDGDWAACEYDNGICVHIHHLCKTLTSHLYCCDRYVIQLWSKCWDTEFTKMVAGSKDTLGFDQMSQTMMLQYTLDPVVQIQFTLSHSRLFPSLMLRVHLINTQPNQNKGIWM